LVGGLFTYDANGNLTADGMWTYTWGAENRLTGMTTSSAAVTAGVPARILTFQYDYLNRRVQKRVTDAAGTTEYYSRRYLYDGWDLVAEFSAPGGTSLGSIVRAYTWGLDLSGSRTAAGGVGALLQIADYASGNNYLPTYDTNGNVTALLNASTGAVAAAYEYSPFGELLRSTCSDTAIADNVFLFSTKFTDAESGLVYYGNRYYSPNLGRFINRDPVEESGGINLYGFVQNEPVDRWDVLGNADDKNSPNPPETLEEAMARMHKAQGWQTIWVNPSAPSDNTSGKSNSSSLLADSAVANGQADPLAYGSGQKNGTTYQAGAIQSGGVTFGRALADEYVGLGRRLDAGVVGIYNVGTDWFTAGLSLYMQGDISADLQFRSEIFNESGRDTVSYGGVDMDASIVIGTFKVSTFGVANGVSGAHALATGDYQGAQDEFTSAFLGLSSLRAGMSGQSSGGRLGSVATRDLNAEIAAKLENAGWKITNGGGQAPEKYLPGPGPGTKGGNYTDITAVKDGKVLHVNTVSTLADGVTPTANEARAAAQIRAKLGPNERLILIPKRD
jgi:RHS repeat-associated protein